MNQKERKTNRKKKETQLENKWPKECFGCGHPLQVMQYLDYCTEEDGESYCMFCHDTIQYVNSKEHKNKKNVKRVDR